VSIRLFAAAVAFMSAALLFSAQPHWGRRLAPALGGGPAVWNACLVFFQTALLGGYIYALLLLQRWPSRAPTIHALVLVAASVWCVFGPTASITDGTAPPTLQAFVALATSIGPPILALAATAPLAHRWSISNDAGRGSYSVYAASNAGSLLALLVYPTLIEPTLGLTDQWSAWRLGFVTFAVATAVFSRRANANLRARFDQFNAQSSVKPDVAQSPSWLFWSALPSALLVSTTQKITEDVAGGPLLWLPPLAVFLVASILAFAGRSPPLWMFAWALALLLLVRGTVSSIAGVAPTLWIHLSVEIAVLFTAAWCAFAVLYTNRPVDAESSRFYVWLALGGAVGGGLASFAAPHLFHSTAEHPFALLLLVLFLPTPGPRLIRLDLALVLVALLLTFIGRSRGGEAATLEALLLAGGFGMLLALAVRRPPSFGLALAAPLAFALPYLAGDDRRVVAALRSEFGVHRVVEFEAEGARYHALQHSGVIHGGQCREPGRHQEPFGYYHPESALGEAFAWRQRSSQGGDAAFVGLGAGGTLVYRKPQQRFIYFEIDPAVVRLASDPRCFSYVAEAGVFAEIRIGDGRLLIERSPDGVFETILLDAFSGDAVPTHLLTREAFAAYQRTLKPGGAIIVHVSSWFVDLEATVAKAGASVGLYAVSKNQLGGGGMLRPGPAPTRCVVLMNDERRLEELRRRPGWSQIKAADQTPLWTDDFCDLWSVVRLRGQ